MLYILQVLEVYGGVNMNSPKTEPPLNVNFRQLQEMDLPFFSAQCSLNVTVTKNRSEDSLIYARGNICFD